MNRVKFTNRLRNLVLETGESQTSVAIDMGIEQGSLSSYLSGRHEPRATAIVLMANYFGVTTDYLLGVSDDRG